MINADPRNPLHRFPDDVALVLASSIAYKGGDGNGSIQYSSAHYSDAVVWGHLNNINSTSVANLLGRFTVGAIAMMDIINVKGIGSGWALEIGVLLIVDWKLAVRCLSRRLKRFILTTALMKGSILGVITAVHTFLYLSALSKIGQELGGQLFKGWAVEMSGGSGEPALEDAPGSNILRGCSGPGRGAGVCWVRGAAAGDRRWQIGEGKWLTRWRSRI